MKEADADKPDHASSDALADTQFASERVSRGSGVSHAPECARCHRHFPGSDARFCPFDGEPLLIDETNGPSTALIGAVIDKRYDVLEVLGEGGMGTVYRARHTALHREFALKVLRRELAVDPELSARFIQEAKAAAAVSHPSVVQITDFGELPTGEPYFVMELLQGRALSWLLYEQGALSIQRSLVITHQAAEALAAAHEAGVVHRDLKPDNIQIFEADHDRVKVLDFGLAKIIGNSRLTRAGVVFGTPHYMSPEQAAGQSVDARSDIYSLGVVLYEMLTGGVPFDADNYMEVLRQHMQSQPTPPSKAFGGNPALRPLDSFVLRCLAKEPSQRYPSMRELLADLELTRAPGAAIGTALPMSPESLDAPWLERPRESRSPLPPIEPVYRVPVRRRRWPIAAVAVLSFAGAAALAAVLMEQRPPELAPSAALDEPDEPDEMDTKQQVREPAAQSTHAARPSAVLPPTDTHTEPEATTAAAKRADAGAAPRDRKPSKKAAARRARPARPKPAAPREEPAVLAPDPFPLLDTAADTGASGQQKDAPESSSSTAESTPPAPPPPDAPPPTNEPSQPPSAPPDKPSDPPLGGSEIIDPWAE